MASSVNEPEDLFLNLRMSSSQSSTIHYHTCRKRSCPMRTLLLPATKLRQGNVFTPVCHSVHGGGVADSPQSRPPWEQTPPREQTPPVNRNPPRNRHPPGSRPPLCSACWEIRATSGRDASYWNAYLAYFYFCAFFPLARWVKF